jgi:ribosome-binding protein aMBF1 (putative translation factor)
MDVSKVSERTRRRLEAMPPEGRAKAEAAVARTQTPEFRARVAADRSALDREFRETGTIATGKVAVASEETMRVFIGTLKREREAKGLSLADVAVRSGIDKGALSRLENGQQPNPTVNTLTRYADALGKRLALSLEEATPVATD